MSLQHAVIEAAVSRHYACKEVRSLGHGSLGSLLKSIEKHHQHRSRREPAVFYEAALVARQLYVIWHHTVTAAGHGFKDPLCM